MQYGRGNRNGNRRNDHAEAGMAEAGISITGCRSFDGGPCEESGGIEGGQRGDLVVEDERKLGTAQDNGVALMFVMESFDDAEEGRAILSGNPVEDEAIENEGVDGCALVSVGRDRLNAERGQFAWIDRSLHEILGAEDGEALEAPGVSLPSDHLGDVEPREGCFQIGVVHGFMHGVVGTDGKVCPEGSELGAGVGQEVRDGGPVSLFEEAAVLTEAEGVEDDLGVMVGAEQLSALCSNRFVTECRTGSAAGHDPDGPGLSPVLHGRRANPEGLSSPPQFQRW